MAADRAALRLIARVRISYWFDFQWNTLDHGDKPDGSRVDYFLVLRVFVHPPPLLLLKNIPQRPGNVRVVFGASYLLIGRTGQTNDMVGCDAAVLRVESCKFG